VALKVATLQLCGCSGCHISLLDMGKNLSSLIEERKIELSYSQIILDAKTLEENVDVLLVEGSVSTEYDEELLKKYAALSKKVVALGSCACYGGPQAIANRFNRRSVLKKMFVDSANPRRITVPTVDLPAIHEFTCSIDAYVNVDFYVPGCPPEHEILTEFITNVVQGRRAMGYDKAVCDECPRERTGESPIQIRRIIDVAEIDPEKCLVEQGIICMGKMTMSGCGAKCPKANAPCEGCRGFSLILKEVSPTDALEMKTLVRSVRRHDR